jgi:hypothetical protein
MRVALLQRPMLTASAPGNEYEIAVEAQTNRSDWPLCDLQPLPKRVHIQLSTDGGTNFSRYLAYGVPVVSYGAPVTNRAVYYTYSLPWWDESIITERAMLRVTDLEGEEMGRTRETFTIAGLFWHNPADGAVLTANTYIDLEWVQSGAGDAAELGWLTPTNSFTVITTLSNLVAGVNQYTWKVSGLPKPCAQIKLALRSVSDPRVHGQTGILSSE